MASPIEFDVWIAICLILHSPGRVGSSAWPRNIFSGVVDPMLGLDHAVFCDSSPSPSNDRESRVIIGVFANDDEPTHFGMLGAVV